MRILTISLVILAALIGGYIYWWNTVSDEAVRGFDKWKTAQANQGVVVTNKPLTTGGFPYRVELRTSNISIERQDEKLSITDPWVVIEPWNLKHLIFGVGGTLTFERNEKTLAIEPEKAAGSLKLNENWQLKNLAIDLHNSKFSGSLFGKGTTERLQLHFQSGDHNVNMTGTGAETKDLEKSPFLKIAVRADKLKADKLSQTPLGANLDKLHLVAKTDANLTSFASQSHIEAWRDEGGAIEIDEFDIIWGKTQTIGKGTLTLDANNYPLGAFTAKIHGFNPLFDIIIQQQKLDKKSAQTARFALNMLAKTNENGAEYLELPLRFQERAAYLGPLRLFNLQPVF